MASIDDIDRIAADGGVARDQAQASSSAAAVKALEQMLAAAFKRELKLDGMTLENAVAVRAYAGNDIKAEIVFRAADGARITLPVEALVTESVSKALLTRRTVSTYTVQFEIKTGHMILDDYEATAHGFGSVRHGIARYRLDPPDGFSRSIALGLARKREQAISEATAGRPELDNAPAKLPAPGEPSLGHKFDV